MVWSELEIRTLRKYYEAHGPCWIGWRNLLPKRTPKAIESKAGVLGLRVDGSLRAKAKRKKEKHILPLTCGECRFYKQYDPHGIGLCKERHARSMFGGEQKVYAHYQAKGLCAYGLAYEEKGSDDEETDGKE